MVMGEQRVGLQPTPVEPKAQRSSWLIPVLIVAGVIGVLALVVLIVAVRWFTTELAKADPIPGITIEVDTGGAVKPDRVEHAARAYLQRRLRAAGYDQAGVGPLRIEVNFQKVGEIKYQHAGKMISVDDVRLELSFYDSAGKLLKRIRRKPKMGQSEEFQFDAEIGLNETVYGRAVGQILDMKLPRPDEL